MGTEIRIATGVVPEPDSSVKHKTYNASTKGKQRKTLYRDNDYLSRDFVAWDGEGGNEADGSHTYFLLACSDGRALSLREGLPTFAIMEMFLATPKGGIHVGYGLGYDINMWLRDLSREHLEKLYTTGKVAWGGYYLQWRGGKSFAVRRGDSHFIMYDVLPFFQRSFVAACDEYLGSSHSDWSTMRENVVREKARRGSFDWSELEGIREYNNSELSLLVSLASELRTRLHRVGIKVTRWDGPGAIASALYKKYETKSHLRDTPTDVAKAARFAYAGGRFEIIRKGHSLDSAYQYDIRSAYPSAARYLPCLAHGKWVRRSLTQGIIRTIKPFGVYRIEVINPPTDSVTQPQPLWMRNKNGTVHFSEYSHGWYWSPEAQVAVDLGGCVIHEAWEYRQECDHEPFHFVEALYNKRAALKKAGDGAHVGLKLGLNSLYGKLAQQIGWTIENGELRIPPYHCLEWAGWITSHCRSQVFKATLAKPHDIIAFETDAVFSRAPLDVPIGERLGEWDRTDYDSLTYLKSGMYFGTLGEGHKCDDACKAKGHEVEKSRGINKGTITRSRVITALDAESRGESPVLMAEQTRFVGLGQALHQDFAKWRHWFTDPRRISVALTGKRIDLLSSEEAYRHLNDGWVETQEGFSETEFSHEYPIAWINPDDNMASPEGLAVDEYRLYDLHEVIIP